MKVLHVINRLGYGGAESLLSDMVCIQRDRGLDVSVVALEERESNFKNKIVAHGIEYKAMSKSWSLYNPLHVFRLVRYIGRYDLVHVHLFPAQYWVGLAKIFSLSGTPVITTEHSTMNNRRNSPILKFIDDKLYRYAYDMTVCCSDEALDAFRSCYPKAVSVSIPNGVDLSRIRSAVPANLEAAASVGKNSFVVTMVARLKYPKRQDTVIEALSLLPPDVCLLLVGGGEESRVGELKRQARDLGVGDRVRFLGIRDDVPSLLKASDVIVLSSEFEGLSLSSVEGMAAGKPFIATDVNGLREVVGGAGLLFEKGNAKELASLIGRLREDRAFYREVASGCAERACAYNIETMVDAYAEVYDAVVRNDRCKDIVEN